jgi:hypothetical protein
MPYTHFIWILILHFMHLHRDAHILSPQRSQRLSVKPLSCRNWCSIFLSANERLGYGGIASDDAVDRSSSVCERSSHETSGILTSKMGASKPSGKARGDRREGSESHQSWMHIHSSWCSYRSSGGGGRTPLRISLETFVSLRIFSKGISPL